MQIVQTKAFSKTVKKLHANQKKDLDGAVREILENPGIGQQKIGDLSGIFVHKFSMVNQLTLLAYTRTDETITLLALGSHQNFYRDLKNQGD